MKIVFIAGPLTTGGDGSREYIVSNIDKAEQFQIALINQGIGVFCPHTHTQFPSEKGSIVPDAYYYELDLEFLKRIADAVVMLPGWEKSWGATNEEKIAKELGLPVFYPESPEKIEDVIAWHKNNL